MPDRVSRHRSGVYERFMHVDGRPILVRAWSRAALGDGSRSRRLPAPAPWLGRRRRGDRRPTPTLEGRSTAIRHALAVDDDLVRFHAPIPRATRCWAR